MTVAVAVNSVTCHWLWLELEPEPEIKIDAAGFGLT